MAYNYGYIKTDSIWEDKEWDAKDFNLTGISLINKSNFPDVNMIKAGNVTTDVYSFSKPILYQKKYCIFTVAKSISAGLYLGTFKVIVMERKKGKWNIVHEIDDYNMN